MKLGIGAYTIRQEIEDDPFKALKNIAYIGYTAIEFCNIGADKYPESIGAFNIDQKELKALIDDLGLKVTGSLALPGEFLSIEQINTLYDNYELMNRFFEFNKSLGAENATIGIGFYNTKDYLLRRCEAYNKLGTLCNKHGLRLLYHNHYEEFQMFGNDLVLDLLVENTDPKFLAFELDAYWVFRSAYDPVRKLKQYGQRVELLHVKDYPFDQAKHIDLWAMIDQQTPVFPETFMNVARPDFFVELGDGMIKIQDIIDLGNELGIRYLFVEQDQTALASGMESIKRSFSNMKKMRGLEW
jgi:sugar phosphate isomerase/epimerase